MDFRKIMVPVHGSPVDAEVLKLVCRMAKQSKAKVFVVYVVEVRRSLPLDARLEGDISRGEDALTQAEQTLEEEECEYESSLLQAREVGPALVEEAVERHVDAIVMGIGYKRRFGEYSLGEAVPYVLKNASCPVLVYRIPALEKPE
ncbi:MAG: universal stress protein [Chloroflexi bacterium]|nr:universal stress protein [Chloroflexota bacterium]